MQIIGQSQQNKIKQVYGSKSRNAQLAQIGQSNNKAQVSSLLPSLTPPNQRTLEAQHDQNMLIAYGIGHHDRDKIYQIGGSSLQSKSPYAYHKNRPDPSYLRRYPYQEHNKYLVKSKQQSNSKNRRPPDHPGQVSLPKIQSEQTLPHQNLMQKIDLMAGLKYSQSNSQELLLSTNDEGRVRHVE